MRRIKAAAALTPHRLSISLTRIGMDMRPPLSARPVVVIVDDDAAVLAALGFALETEGYQVRAFRTAAAAFAAPGLDAADCLVIDQNLPDEAGVDLLARLRGRGDRAPAVLTANAPSRALWSAAARMNAPVVEKPLLSDHLFSCIREVAPTAQMLQTAASPATTRASPVPPA